MVQCFVGDYALAGAFFSYLIVKDSNQPVLPRLWDQWQPIIRKYLSVLAISLAVIVGITASI
jgi:hypothetical protein